MSEQQPRGYASDPDGQQGKVSYRDAKVEEGWIACTLAESASGDELNYDILDKHYKSYVTVRDEHRKATTITMTIWATLFLLQIGGLEKAEIMGVEPHGDVLKMVGLLAVCFSFMRAMEPWQKAGLYGVYFQHLYQHRAGNAAIRQELVLRYPMAFEAVMFLREVVGMPEGWKWRHTIWRLKLIKVWNRALFLIYVTAFFWLLGAVTIDVMKVPGRVGLFWTWIFVIASALCLLSGFTISSQRHRVLTYGVPVDSDRDNDTPTSPAT